MGGRRAGRQDPRHRRPRAHRPAGGAAGPGVRDAARGLRPLRVARPGPADVGRAAPARAPGRGVRLRHHPPAQDQGHHRPVRQGAARPGQARAPAGQRRPGRHRRRGGPDLGGAGGPGGRRRARRVRHRADHGVVAVRARRGGGDAPPRRLDPGGPGQGRRHHRGDGAAGPGRRVRALRGERVGRRGLRDGPALPPAGRAAGPAVRVAGRGPARQPRDLLRGRPGRLRHPHPHPVGAAGVCSAACRTSPSPT